MKQKGKILYALFLCSFWSASLNAQETIPATGGTATGSGGTVSYSVGQLTYNTFSGINGTVTQGVQQPYEISVVTGIDDAKGIDLICSAFPNPVTDYITLKVENNDITFLSYQLFDINGNLLENKKIEGSETTISMGTRSSSVYFLKVTDKNKVVKTFKIVKN